MEEVILNTGTKIVPQTPCEWVAMCDAALEEK